MQSQQTATAAMQAGPFFRSPEDAALHYDALRREYILRCEPYVRIMCDLRNIQSVSYKMRILPGGGYGEMETEVLWREKDKQMYDQCQEMIDQIRGDYATREGKTAAASLHS